jgi:hypothetical protein
MGGVRTCDDVPPVRAPADLLPATVAVLRFDRELAILVDLAEPAEANEPPNEVAVKSVDDIVDAVRRPDQHVAAVGREAERRQQRQGLGRALQSRVDERYGVERALEWDAEVSGGYCEGRARRWRVRTPS